MAITVTGSKLHWNFFVALESDLAAISRYIEFIEDNFEVYSIELARLLFSAASESDVVAKKLCKKIDVTSNPNNIHECRVILCNEIPEICTMETFVPRHGLRFIPWLNWSLKEPRSPDWWRSYNNVKHNRDVHFREATLKNALNSLGALLILTYNLYRFELSGGGELLKPQKVNYELYSVTNFLRLDESLYYNNVVV